MCYLVDRFRARVETARERAQNVSGNSRRSDVIDWKYYFYLWDAGSMNAIATEPNSKFLEHQAVVMGPQVLDSYLESLKLKLVSFDEACRAKQVRPGSKALG